MALAADHAVVAVVADLAELRARLRDDASDGCSALLVDELETWSTDDQRALARLITFERPSMSMLLAGRRIVPELREAMSFVGARMIGLDELRWGRDEIVEILADLDPSEEQLRRLMQVIDGWPLLGLRTVEFVRTVGYVPSIASSHPVIGDVVVRCLDELDSSDRLLLGQLAHVDQFSAPVASALAPGLLDRLRVAGLPIDATPDGRLRLIDPVRERLLVTSHLDVAVAPRMAVALIQSDMHLDAVRLLLRAGRPERSAQVLIGLSLGQLDAIPPDDLLATLDLLADQHDAHLRLHLVRVRALGNAARVTEQLEAINVALAAADEHDDEALRVEAQSELLFIRAMMATGDGGLLTEIERLEASVKRTHVLTRLMEAKSIVFAQSDDLDDLERAISLSQQTTNAWVALGERSRAASTLRTRAMTMLVPLGRWIQAESTIERAVKLPANSDLDRLSSLVVAVFVDALLARDAHGRVTETLLLAEALDLSWAESYVRWALMMHAGFAGDAAVARREFDSAWRSLGQLREHPTGALVLVAGAEALARSGDRSGAAELLDRAASRRDECPEEFVLAEVCVAAYGAPGVADVGSLAAAATERITRRPALAWKLRMYEAVALAATDAEAARATAEVAARLAAPWCGDGIVERYAPGLFSGVGDADPADDRRAAAPARDAPATLPSPDHELSSTTVERRVQVLGGFSVAVAGNPIDLVGDRVASMVKTIAIGLGQASVDVVIDRLWPDSSTEVGRRRLKNVLSRSRQAVGDLIERDGDALRFNDGVTLDLEDFSNACRSATYEMANDEPTSAASSLHALSLYRGPLLPGDLYDDDVAPARVAYAAQAMAIFDGLLTPDARPVIGPALLSALFRIDPDDIVRFEALAEWSLELHQDGLARSAAQQLASVAESFGLDVPPVAARVLARRAG